MACLHVKTKDDYPLIWAPGLVSTTLPEVASTFGVGSPEREALTRALNWWAIGVRETGVSVKAWICGSYLTSKPSPRDIDLIVWPAKRVYIGTDAERANSMFDRKHVYMNYGIDIHIEGLSSDEDFEKEAYYLGFYGFGWDRRTPRTIAEIVVNP